MLQTYKQWAGTLGPVRHTPDRRPGSVRRTSSIRTTWPEGVEGDVFLTAAGRDLLTTTDGRGVTTDRVSLEVRAGGPLRTVTSIRSDTKQPDVQLLEGCSLKGGFRKAVATRLALRQGALLALLLDDVPAAALVSGSARLRAILEATGDLPGF